jgi:rhamnulokinase
MNTFLAFDLGAESGRAMIGRLRDGRLTLEERSRFSNDPVREGGTLRWDAEQLWMCVQSALEDAAGAQDLTSIGVDTWGCDYALVDASGSLVERPYHYRDRRTDGVMNDVFRHVPADRIYATTGIQFLPFNTLFQLYAACRLTPAALDAAATLLTMPDWLNFRLTGRRVSEYTSATTTQCVDARARTWATPLLDELGIPTRLLAPLVEPGTVLGPVHASAGGGLTGRPVVVAPACHDTGSAVASVWAGGATAFVSSGTWSLLGTEIAAPILSERARELNFTNEGGVGGTTRLLKNIAGLWLLQSCRRDWAAAENVVGPASAAAALGYDTLLEQAAAAEPFRACIDPDDPSFLHPDRMPVAIAAYCRATDQPEPRGVAGYARTILESLALAYRAVLTSLEELTGTRFSTIRVVGGGARNQLLNQFTADATGRLVLAGPVEATALGNIGVQMIATGAVDSLAAARELIDRSFPPTRFEPRGGDDWDRQYARFRGLRGAP